MFKIIGVLMSFIGMLSIAVLAVIFGAAAIILIISKVFLEGFILLFIFCCVVKVILE